MYKIDNEYYGVRQRLTGILPKLLPYLALTKKVYFCGRCSRW